MEFLYMGSDGTIDWQSYGDGMYFKIAGSAIVDDTVVERRNWGLLAWGASAVALGVWAGRIVFDTVGSVVKRQMIRRSYRGRGIIDPWDTSDYASAA